MLLYIKKKYGKLLKCVFVTHYKFKKLKILHLI